MLHMKVKKHRLLFITLFLSLLIFGGSMGAVLYFGNTVITKQLDESAQNLEKLDNEIARIKREVAAKKKAEEEAAKKAAEQKAASDAALKSQLQGQVVTPTGCAVNGDHGDPNKIDVVINKKRCFNPIDFTPSDLSSYNGFVMSAKIIPDMTAMFNAAATAGVPLSLTSAYRSYSNQVSTYNYWVAANGSTAAADTVSARPGYSEHQTGFAVDFSAGGCSLECFRGSAQYAWMQANAATYGFIERYPQGLESITSYSPEAWHWRYVGPSTAKQMKSSNVKSLEQLWNIPGGNY
jgi:zinc D-Ala-D-Ala carboxypeptidase